MTIQWIVIMGARGVGKSVAANHLRRQISDTLARDGVYKRIIVDSYDQPVRHFVASMLGEKWQEMDHEKARPELNGRSVKELVREFFAGDFLEKFGIDLFARTLVHRNMGHQPMPSIVIVDAGFIGTEPAYLNKSKIVYIVRGERKLIPKPSHPDYMIRNDDTRDVFHTYLDRVGASLAQFYLQSM